MSSLIDGIDGLENEEKNKENLPSTYKHET